MLSGKPVFSGSPEEIVYKIRYSLPEPLAQVPVNVRNVLSKMLAKDPLQRYALVSDALHDLSVNHAPVSSGMSGMSQLSQIAPHLGKAGHADESDARNELQMGHLPELPRGTAYVPLEPVTRVRLQDFDVSGQDIVEIHRRR
jgi:serine/threonine protein kinase